MGKAVVTPTNIPYELKKFIVNQKTEKYKKFMKFFSEGDILLSYLEENPRFVKDFEEFKNGL